MAQLFRVLRAVTRSDVAQWPGQFMLPTGRTVTALTMVVRRPLASVRRMRYLAPANVKDVWNPKGFAPATPARVPSKIAVWR